MCLRPNGVGEETEMISRALFATASSRVKSALRTIRANQTCTRCDAGSTCLKIAVRVSSSLICRSAFAFAVRITVNAQNIMKRTRAPVSLGQRAPKAATSANRTSGVALGRTWFLHVTPSNSRADHSDSPQPAMRSAIPGM